MIDVDASFAQIPRGFSSIPLTSAERFDQGHRSVSMAQKAFGKSLSRTGNNREKTMFCHKFETEAVVEAAKARQRNFDLRTERPQSRHRDETSAVGVRFTHTYKKVPPAGYFRLRVGSTVGSLTRTTRSGEAQAPAITFFAESWQRLRKELRFYAVPVHDDVFHLPTPILNALIVRLKASDAPTGAKA